MKKNSVLIALCCITAAHAGLFEDDEIDTAEKEDCNYQIDSTKLTSHTIFKDDADQTSNRLLAFME